MKLDIRHANHPEDVKRYNTTELREHFLVQNLFEADKVSPDLYPCRSHGFRWGNACCKKT